MSCYAWQLTLDGPEPMPYEADSLADAARYEPEGVYTITNTYPGLRALMLDAHLTRLEDSARRADMPVTLDRARLRAALREVIQASGNDVVRFRITLPRAATDQPILSIEPFQPPAPEVYTRGIRCATVGNTHRENPAAKTTAWMSRRREVQDALPSGVYEGLLVSDDGRILEGLSSNFYAIVGGRLYTAADGILPGISRLVVFEVAPKIIPLSLEAVRVDEITRLEEAFITSASRAIVPVVEIDGVTIGAGVPGPVTRRLGAAYNDWVAAHLEPI